MNWHNLATDNHVGRYRWALDVDVELLPRTITFFSFIMSKDFAFIRGRRICPPKVVKVNGHTIRLTVIKHSPVTARKGVLK